MTKRLLVCGACLAAMAAVVVSVVMAIGIELVQRERDKDKWRPTPLPAMTTEELRRYMGPRAFDAAKWESYG